MNYHADNGAPYNVAQGEVYAATRENRDKILVKRNKERKVNRNLKIGRGKDSDRENGVKQNRTYSYERYF